MYVYAYILLKQQLKIEKDSIFEMGFDRRTRGLSEKVLPSLSLDFLADGLETSDDEDDY